MRQARVVLFWGLFTMAAAYGFLIGLHLVGPLVIRWLSP